MPWSVDISLPLRSLADEFLDALFQAPNLTLSLHPLKHRRLFPKEVNSAKWVLGAIAAELRLVTALQRTTLRHYGSWFHLLKVRAVSAIIIAAPPIGPDRDTFQSLNVCSGSVITRQYFLEHRHPLGSWARPNDLGRRGNRSFGTHRVGWGIRRGNRLLFRVDHRRGWRTAWRSC